MDANSKDERKKVLLANIIHFLNSEVTNSSLSEEKKESIEVAIQCLETAYDISGDIRDSVTKLDLLNLVQNNEASDVAAQIEAEEHKNAGNALMKSGSFQAALDEYSKAIKCYPKNAVYYCNRAAAQSRLERHQEAINDCKTAIKLDSKYGKAYGRLGIAYSSLNMFAEARDALAIACKFDPNNSVYEKNLKLAEEQLQSSADTTNPQQRPVDLSQFFSNETFINLAQEVMNNPQFHDMMSGFMQMGNSGDANFETLLQMGQTMASTMQNRDPGFADNLRRTFEQRVDRQQNQDDPEDNDQGPSQS